MDERAAAGDHEIDLTELVRALALVAGIVVEAEGTGSLQVDHGWFDDPIASLRAIPNDATRRGDIVDLLKCVLPEPPKNPTLDPTGAANAATWFPLPRPAPAASTTPTEESPASAEPNPEESPASAEPNPEESPASAEPNPEESPASSEESPASAAPPGGVFLVADAGDDSLVAGIGLWAAGAIGQTTVSPFVEFPLVSLPPLPGDPVLFINDGATYRVVAGVRIAAPGSPVAYAGHSYDTWHMQAGFDATAGSLPTVGVFARAGDDDFSPLTGDFSGLGGVVDTVLRIGDVAGWLERPIVSGNDDGPTAAKILVAAGLLVHGDDGYALGDLTELEHLTLQGLLEHALQALGGLRLIEIHGDPQQGLFIEARRDEASDSTRYGLRLAMNDIVISEPATPSDGGATLTLQLGKGFDAATGTAGEGTADGEAATGGGDKAELEAAATGGEAGDWTNSDSPPGIGVTLLNVPDDGDIAFAVGVELVSVGFDYVDDGPTGILNTHGFQMAGVQPRLYLSIVDGVNVGAAVRLEDLELPLDSTFGDKTAGSNPVAGTLISGKSTEASESGTDSAASSAPARTKFSASVAFDAKHTFHATLYDKDRRPTTDPIWFDVEKSFGPVSLHKLGISWSDPERTVAFLVDGGVALAGLDVELESLSIAIPVRNPSSTTLGLKGLDISYSAGPIEIAGGFAEFDSPDGPEYDGQAMIKVASFTLSALGAYGQLDGHPSMFIFALIDVPLGGPPCFFINGLAGGFGYNRGLKMPTIDELPRYPFVRGAMSDGPDNPFTGRKDPRSAIEVLHDTAPPAYGEYWIAAGIRFASFEMIQSFALLTVKFGTDFELDLLGLSEASIPPGATDPIANVELALLVTFAPSRGLIAVSAKLTDRSYVFSKSCQLTGGFAFYLWFADDAVSGAPAGQFVVTLGGYHPHFVPPKYFPDEPRLGLNWQISTALTVKGGLYFALTPAAIMAGGYLTATFNASIITAWFNAHADFLLGWKPFHYETGVGIDLGATIRLPVLVATIVITVEVGVDLELWGPAFGGTVVVHLLFISFTIPFGSAVPSPPPIGLDEFATSFLPKDTSPNAKNTSPDSTQPRALEATNPSDSPAPVAAGVCGTRVAAGLLKDLSGDPDRPVDWVVDPLHMQLVIDTAVPAKEILLVTPAGARH